MKIRNADVFDCGGGYPSNRGIKKGTRLVSASYRILVGLGRVILHP